MRPVVRSPVARPCRGSYHLEVHPSVAGVMHIAAANGDSKVHQSYVNLFVLGGDGWALMVVATPSAYSCFMKAVSYRMRLLHAGRVALSRTKTAALHSCALNRRRKMKTTSVSQWDEYGPREMDIIPKYQSMTLSWIRVWWTHLIEGWLSPECGKC
jgi:hypothetical protein